MATLDTNETALQRFTYHFDPTGDTIEYFPDFEIRVVVVEGKPWFVGRDIAILLGYDYPADAIRRHCKHSKSWKDLKGVDETSTPKILQPATKLIPESDLYRLVMKSDMEEAERFQDWVCEEVLPTIRKTGGTYMTDDALARTISDPDYMIGVLQQMKTLKAERDDALLREAEAIRTKAHVAKGREGTLASKVMVLAKENKKLKSKYETPDRLEASAIPWLKDYFKKSSSTKVLTLIGYDLRKIHEQLGLEIIKRADSRYSGGISLHHVDAIAVFRGRVERGDIRPIYKSHLK